jgi:single-stranded-DNA-specific exonuclease
VLLGHTEKKGWPASEDALAEARTFLEGLRGRHVIVAPHTDVDGLSSGALVLRALERSGARVEMRVPGKGEHAHSPAFQERLHRAQAEALVVLDMGSRPAPIVPGLPTLVVDHHQPDGFPPEAHVLSGTGVEPVAPTALLTYVLVSPFIEPASLEWLAVLGTVGDLGADAPMPFLPEALKRAGRTAVTETVALLNAARRSSHFAAGLALEVLLRAEEPADIQRGRVPGVKALTDCRIEVQSEVARCSRTPPRIVKDVALLLFSSGAQIHPLVAVRWAQRLPEHIVIAANAGYLPGRVNFALRSKQPRDLIAFLRGLELPPMQGEFAQGHPQATGGSLAPEDFLRLMGALDFRGLQPRDVEPRGFHPG